MRKYLLTCLMSAALLPLAIACCGCATSSPFSGDLLSRVMCERPPQAEMLMEFGRPDSKRISGEGRFQVYTYERGPKERRQLVVCVFNQASQLVSFRAYNRSRKRESIVDRSQSRLAAGIFNAMSAVVLLGPRSGSFSPRRVDGDLDAVRATYSSGVNLDAVILQKIDEGKCTRGDVHELLGNPNIVEWFDDDRLVVDRYTYDEVVTESDPGIGGSSHILNKTVTLKYSLEDGILLKAEEETEEREFHY